MSTPYYLSQYLYERYKIVIACENLECHCGVVINCAIIDLCYIFIGRFL